MAKSSSTKSWERQPNESAKAYEAFSLYLDMGAGRSLQKVAQELSKSLTLMKRWCKDWNWVERCADYDAEQRRIELEQTKKEVKKMRERQLGTAILLQKKAVQALNELDFEDLSPQMILRFIAAGAKMEQDTHYSQLAESITEDESKTTGTLADFIVQAYEKRGGD